MLHLLGRLVQGKMGKSSPNLQGAAAADTRWIKADAHAGIHLRYSANKAQKNRQGLRAGGFDHAAEAAVRRI
ncbi:hypothetical protein [Janthinobacterium rivuli]|uniref:hypothetical protein n=1 Tax=Janthinobacterium rivuli TaxID=2751478 RepID=UPI00383AC6BF